MILYFTGTGNSKFIATGLSKKLSDEIVSLNDVIKFNKDKAFTSSKPFVIVAPIYAWRLPRVIEGLLRASKFNGNKNIYFVVTMGGESGKCDDYCKAIANELGMNYMGFRGIVMPDNYISMFTVEDDDEIKARIENALIEIDTIAKDILDCKFLQKTDKTIMASFMSKQVNYMFYKWYVNDKSFVVSNECILCGLCEKVCPLNNIKIENGKILFNHKCINCYSCIHRCPKKAINVKGKTETKKRYVCKEYEE